VPRAKVVDGGLQAEALARAKDVEEMRPVDDLLVLDRLENDPSIGKRCFSAASSVLRMQNCSQRPIGVDRVRHERGALDKLL
jgi:hypothetical protein